MLNSFLTYGLLMFYFTLYLIAAFASARSDSGQLKFLITGKGEQGILLSRMLAGIFFLGIGSFQIILSDKVDTSVFILSFDYLNDPVLMIIVCLAIFIGLASAMKKDILPDKIFTGAFTLTFLITRIIFLVTYEFFFRGVMLYVVLQDFGIITAIAVNIILYVLSHWPDKEERYGSILMGAILCAVVIHYHSVWPAIIIHLALALSHEITILVKTTKTKKVGI